jgi:signal transduction histidine kinase
MDMFALNEDLMRWDSALLPLHGAQRLAPLMALAWHLRQRDTVRAVALAHEALALLPDAGLAPNTLARHTARLTLVLAEASWLNGALDEALLQTQAIQASFAHLGDDIGCADTHWLLAWIAIDRGEHTTADIEFEACAETARLAGDALRTELAEAAGARWAVLRDRKSALARWGEHFAPDVAERHPALSTWVNDFLAVAASQAGELGEAAGYFMRCHQGALDTGQLRAAITAATNIGEGFSLINDHQSALDWLQRALALARPAGWPRSLGACLTKTADTLRLLGQLDAAHGMLRQGLEILKPLENARSFAVGLQCLGDLALDQGDYEAALDAFSRLEERARALGQPDFFSIAWRGQAHALSHLARPQEALVVAHAAVALALDQAHPPNQIAALQVVAMIHARHRLAPPPRMSEPTPALHYLRQALAVAATLPDYTVPGELYDAMGREYAAINAFERAYEVALAAGAAREKTHSQEATNRAIAMQVHQQTETARREADYHRQLAESEARRAEVLQRTGSTLERLSKIGQEITAHLDAAAVFQALGRHIHGLLNASTFAIYLSDASGTELSRAFAVELGHLLPPEASMAPDPQSYPARCMAERREICIEHGPDPLLGKPRPCTSSNQSALFVPLTIGERVIGVMTVQALYARAYGENERMIFRTLCAYGAIALDNADAYRQLGDAQTELVSQQRLAALGALVAGVAHELNTPIGNCLLIASTMQEKTAQLGQMLVGPGLRRSELASYVSDAAKAAELMMRGLAGAADLISSFKQVAVDRTTEQRRNFNLHQVCHEVVATLMNRIRAAGHDIELRVDEAIGMDSHPGPLGQVLTNLINNALLHAFDQGHGGRMVLSASSPQEGRVRIEFRDDGAGIAQQHLERIFDPFFTTKLGQGGSGLGLSISYNIVTSLLGGQITVDSGEGAGTCFGLDLPLTAPLPEPAPAAAPP